MESQDQNNQAALQPQQKQQQTLPQTQPQQTNVGQETANTIPSLDQTPIPQQLPMDATFMNFDPNAMAGMMPNQMLSNQAMAGMGMADPSIMVPLMLPNGGSGLQPNGVSAGMFISFSPQKDPTDLSLQTRSLSMTARFGYGASTRRHAFKAPTSSSSIFVASPTRSQRTSSSQASVHSLSSITPSSLKPILAPNSFCRKKTTQLARTALRPQVPTSKS